MELNEFVNRYSKSFVLCKDKTLKDLEPYGFKPTYDTNTGELIKETLWISGLYGDRPVMEMSNKELEPDFFTKKVTLHNPLKSFVMNFFHWWYGDYYYHNREYSELLDIEIKKVDETNFNVILDLIEDNIITREKR